jgi:hypothetical protein
MADYENIARVIRDNPAAFAAAETFAEFSALKNNAYDGYSWADDVFQTLKHNPHCRSGHPLWFPKARKFSDLFESAVVDQAFTGPGNIHTGTQSKNIPGYYMLSANSARGAAYSGNMGGRRYVQMFRDGTCVRGRSGCEFFVTKVKWKVDFKTKARKGMISHDISSCEAITWADGEILITARDSHGIGTRWVAVLDPGSKVDEIMTPENLAFLASEKAADDAAWSCIYTGEDGREYLNREFCTVEIRSAR